MSTHITQLPPQPSSFYDPVDRRINRQPTTPPSTHNHPLTNKYDDESLINRLKSLLIDQTSPPQKKRAPYQTPSVTEYPTHSQPSPVLVQSISANYSQPTTYTDVADDIHSIDQDQNSESEDYAGDRVHLRTGHRKKHILGTIVREPIRKKRISRKKVTSHQTESESEEEEALSNADLSQSSPTPLIRHCPPEPAPTRQSRPQSQHSSSSIIRPKTATIRKANPMEKYHQYNSEWERNPYLKHNKHHRKTIIIGKRPEQAHEPFRPPELVEPHSKSIPQPSEYVVPTKKRRDRLVWQVRSQMADEDY
ncbi:hypothetical protein BLNAU_9468 [Blattamonas nauphoetae]|uniref:Centriolar and ciliogenesis-associated protein HYLS1 C-terminal domain-containing protein n=1 Tax=Blattamonas nauphoetae TaxID=2049346 RepID=A0ABQ9XVV0_9EUKA|nr:hypothetical protein BLNAU_9468 [Blattamonas nauphoetae]